MLRDRTTVYKAGERNRASERMASAKDRDCAPCAVRLDHLALRTLIIYYSCGFRYYISIEPIRTIDAEFVLVALSTLALSTLPVACCLPACRICCVPGAISCRVDDLFLKPSSMEFIYLKIYLYCQIECILFPCN